MHNRDFCMLVAGLFLYSLYPIFVLGVATFVFGTGDFSEWGMQGRLGTAFVGGFGLMIYIMLIEFPDIRKTLGNLLHEAFRE